MYVQRNSSVKPYFEKQYFTKNHVIDFFSFHTGVLHDILYKSFMKVIGTVKNSRKSQETVKGHWNFQLSTGIDILYFCTEIRLISAARWYEN